MNDILCGYQGDREATLMAYLYDELSSAERAEFDRHLTTCARCRVELTGLGDVRAQLAKWAPPEPSFAVVGRQSSATGPQPSTISDQPWWQRVPVWAQAAAAMLILGASAGIANLDVHYDAQNGLNVRTGWSKPAAAAPIASVASGATLNQSAYQAASQASNQASNQTVAASGTPWRADLVALSD